jgi:glycosyltransferase involved in cell wall biosynthesis
MKIFTYFVEPAIYSLDLIKNVHDKQGIQYCFIKNYSEAKSESKIANNLFLSNRNFLSKIKFIYTIWKENKLIIINGYNNFPFVVTFILNLIFLDKKFIAIESDTPLRIPENKLKRWMKIGYLNVIFKSKFILGFAGGNFSHKDLFRHYGMQENKIFLMPMLVDNSRFIKNEIKGNIPFRFLFVGRFISTKNIDKLVQLFVKHFSGLNAELIIAGGGDLFAQYNSEFRYYNVKFLGKVFGDDLVELYHSSAVFVFPSTFEAWGLVVNEAMSAGLPVVLRKEVGAANDLVLNNETGFIASNFDEFAKHMLTLYYDKVMLLKYSENAKNFMIKNWNYELYLRQLKIVIKTLKINF